MTLEKIVADFRRGILKRRQSHGRCWLISQPLAAFLEFLGHECTVIEGLVDEREPHVWIKLRDGRIIDATADQFSTRRRPMPKVYIGAQPKWYREIAHGDPEVKKIMQRSYARRTCKS